MKAFLLTLSLLFATTAVAQQPYDSLWNTPKTWNDCQRLKGQKVIVRPHPLRRDYEGFAKLDRTVYAKSPKNNASLYDSLSNREFTVIDVSRKYNLIIADNKDTLQYYWLGGGGFEPQYVFITKGYIEKLRDSLKGTKYIYIGRGNDGTDPFTNEKVVYKTKQQFVFEDVYIDEKMNLDIAICALFKLDNGKHITKPMTMLNDVFIPLEQLNKLKKRYGSYWVDLALQKKIQVGMPADLVVMSWGKPQDINRSSYGPDQWCYDNQYVYIQNGKVTAWN